MRLFVAIELSPAMKASLIDVQNTLYDRGVRGSFPTEENLHLTLAFLGELPDAAPVKEAMRSVSFKPFRLAMSEMGTFGDTLWVGLKGNQGMSSLARSLREAFDSSGIAYDRKAFVPHITIARKFRGDYRLAPVPKGDMMVKKISLMKSEVKDGKRVYKEIFSV